VTLSELRGCCYRQMFVKANPEPGLSIFNRILAIVILASIFAMVLETEPSFVEAYGDNLRLVLAGFAILFAVEYLIRVWVAGHNPEFQGFRGRLRYMLSFGALVDLIAFLPALLSLGGIDSFILRLARIARIVRFAKLGYYSRAIQNIESAVRQCGRELMISFAIAWGLILLGATLMYLVEGAAQPEVFGSIPRALWWSVVTLTTVGYGDTYPVTALGQICASMVAFVGVGTVALPAGILAGAFQQGAAQRREQQRDQESV